MPQIIKATTLVAVTILWNALAVAQNQTVIDSLEARLGAEQNDSIKVNILNELCRLHVRTDFDKAFGYIEQALMLAEHINYPKGISASKGNMGIIHKNKGEYDKALRFYQESIQIDSTIGNMNGIATTLMNVGEIHREKGNYSQAIENYRTSIAIYQSREDHRGIGRCLSNIGIVYDYYEEDAPKAIELYNEALKHLRIAEDSIAIAVVLGNIGAVYELINEDDSALVYNEKAMHVLQRLNLQKDIARITHNNGLIYGKRKDYKQAFKHLFEALSLYKGIGDQRGTAITLRTIGEIHAEAGDIDLALMMELESLEKAETMGLKDELKRLYEDIALYYEEKEAYETAYSYYKKYSAVKDSLFHLQSDSVLKDIETKYETAKKEQTIKLQQSELEKQAALNRTFLIGGGLALVIALLGFVLYFQRRKYSNNLLQQNTIIEKQKGELAGQLETTEEKLQQSLNPSAIIPLKTYGKVVAASDILYVEAAGNYVKIQLQDESYLERSTFTGFVDKLPESIFCRINRSHTVNIEKVKTLGSLSVTMENGKELKVTRSRWQDLKRYFE